MIETTVYGNRKSILIGQDSFHISLPVVVSGEANGVIKAGQPLTGDLKDRNTAFTASTSGAVGVNLHEVKLDKQGKGNATIVAAGCIDLLKLDTDMQTALTTAAIDNIILTKGSAI